MTTSKHTHTKADQIYSGAIRQMNNFERVFYGITGYKVVTAFRVQGSIDITRLQNAFSAVQKIHPLLRSKVVFDKYGKAWYSDHNVEPPESRVIPRKASTQWYDLFVDELKEPYDPETRPMINLVLLQGEDTSDLMIFASHTISDGMSLMYLGRDLLQLYADPEMKVTERFPFDIMDYLPKQKFSLKEWISQRYIHYINKRWAGSPYHFSNEDYRVVNEAFWQKYQYEAVFLELEPDETQQLYERCKQEKVSVGMAVAVAVLAAHEKLEGALPDDLKRVSIPFDLRRHSTTPIGDIFGLCSGIFNFQFTYQKGQGFWANVRKMHEIVQKKADKLDMSYLWLMDMHPTLVDGLANFHYPTATIPQTLKQSANLSRFASDKDNLAMKLAKPYFSKTSGLLSSNLGKLNIPTNYGDLTLDRAMLIPMMKHKIPLYMTGVTFNGRLVFGLSYVIKPNEKNSAKTETMIQIRNLALKILGFPDKESSFRMS